MSRMLFALVLGLTIAASVSGSAQIRIIHREGGGKSSFSSGELMELPELASFVLLKEGKLVVDNVFDKNIRPKGYETVDIREGDVIMMVNGKRVKTVAELKEQYAAAAIGSSVKLGVQRDDNLMIVAFDKADPEKLPKHKVIVRNGDGSGPEDFMLVPGAGLLIGSRGKEVTIDDVDSDGSALKNADVKKGDAVVEVNGKQVAGFKSFSSAYKGIAVGDTVTLTTSRNGDRRSFSFPKAQGGQQKIIKRMK